MSRHLGLDKHQLKLLALILIVVVALAGVSYAMVNNFFGNSPVPKVTWYNIYGSVITSTTLSFTAPGSTSQTVKFTCNPSAGAVTLSLTPSLSVVSLSQTDFSSCSSTFDSVTITATSTGPLSVNGTLHVTQPYNYRTLAVPLQVIIQIT